MGNKSGRLSAEGARRRIVAGAAFVFAESSRRRNFGAPTFAGFAFRRGEER